MSQVNVEVVRQSLVAFDRHDRAAWLALRDERFEVIPSGIWPEAEVILGREAAWEFYVEVIEAFERQPLADAELVDVGADTVLAHHRNDLRGKTSGAEVELDFSVVVTFRNGKILRDRWFTDRAEALAAVGLAE